MKKIFLKAGLSFISTFALCAVLIIITLFNRMNVEKLTMEQLIVEKSMKAQEVISRLLYKAQTLSALVLQNNGEVENFEKVAATLIDDPSIMNLLIAPDGVVSDVYPLEGNESVIGLDFFSEGAGNKEAVMAKESGELVFGGPFDSVQGSQVLVGRLPIYISGGGDDEKSFWGLVSVTLKYPDALNGVGFNELKAQGFAFEIWRVSPDTGEKQIIAGSGYNYNSKTRYIEKQMSIINAEWYFRILPVKAWYEYPETWVLIFLSLCVSLLVAFVVQNNSELKVLKSEFENLARTDPLTGIYNRRHFMELAINEIERTSRNKSGCFIIMFDIDHFKIINDKYGHTAGDKVIREIALRLKEALRSYDLLARYGGEEFIILVTDINQEKAVNLAERIRLNIEEEPFKYKNNRIKVTASLGVAEASNSRGLNTSIELADKALYMAKEKGRNKTVFLD